MQLPINVIINKFKLMKPIFDMILACTLKKRGIGYQGKLPWRLPKDMKFFKEITTKGGLTNSIIVGRTTFQGMKPLPNRLNIVVSGKNQIVQSQNVAQARSLDQALQIAQERNSRGRIYVIGGVRLFEEGMENCRYIFQTRINEQVPCDTFLTKQHKFPAVFVSKTFSENNLNFDFCQFYNPKIILKKEYAQKEINLPEHEQFQYTKMIEDIMNQGQQKLDRTKVGTIGTFGNIAKYDLSESFPLLTTKKVFWKGVVQELLWFIRGSTNNRELQNKKVHIWDGNGTKQYLKSINLEHREQGDLGPVYGFQWRHWGANYQSYHKSYKNQGIDQLNWLINEIKTNPTSRRLILSAWNPSQLNEMALPPCHVMSQFYVTQSGKLNCAMFQRSCDFGLGIPFNIASYALLTCLIAKVCNLKRGTFTHMMGDTHIYKSHLDVIKKQIDLTPYPFPSLQISEDLTDITEAKAEDIILKNYKSHSKLEMKMAV